MGGGGGVTETKTEISPEYKPYLKFALEEGKGLYTGMSPPPSTLAPEQSELTRRAIQMAADRASAGSQIMPYAMNELQATIQGREVNPFLAGALQQTNRLAADEYLRNIQKTQSQASSMGRYGSAAMGQQVGQAQDIFARNLQEAAGRLSFESTEAERQRQMAAIQAAPGMEQASYADIDRIMKAGQAQESYDLNAIQGKLAAQDIPMQRLQNLANVFYGAPLETKTTATPQGGK